MFCRFLFVLFLSLSGIFCFGQQLHIKYFHVRSPIATLYEDLYVNGSEVMLVQDSLISFNSAGSNDISAIRKNKTVNKNYFISKIPQADNYAERNFFFTGNIEDQGFFVHDRIEKPKWAIEYNKTKKILGYECIKATTTFRGTRLTAYYAKDLKYSIGPFKFFGLPGIILDIREDNNSFNIWKAEKIEFVENLNVNFNPSFSERQKITLKQFVKFKEGVLEKETVDFKKSLPVGVSVISQKRFGIEKKYEWEEG